MAIFREDTFEEEHVLMRATVGLGRHPDNDIVLNDRTLSRFHARLERRGAEYVVIDLGAQNGVYLNGQRITGEHALTAGDRIGLGCYVAIFDLQGNATSRRRSDPTPEKHSAPVALPTNALTPLLYEPSSQGTSELVDLDLDLDVDFSNEAENFEDNTTNVEAKDENQPTLVLMYNGEEVSRHPVSTAPMVIGRSKTCDIVISLLGLSRRHTRVCLIDEQIHVSDLGSQNGTWINNHRIDGERSLKHGDLLNYYEYGVLYLKDPSVDIGPPGVEFDVDGRTGPLDAVETHRHSLENIPQVSKHIRDAARDKARTSMSPVPIINSDMQASSVAGSADREEYFDLFDGFDLDDNNSYLNEVDEDDEDDPGLLNLLDDDDDDEDDFKPYATEVLQKKLGLGGPVVEKTRGDLSLNDPSLSDPSLSDPSLSDPSLSDPSLSDPSLSDPSLSDLALGDLDS
ncbi:MAG: FHA domain-containing protein, partial [Deltaproteobacteria bacterium]|nr:FHA domain-containing protein [Deltaproteobacteria bacterium]